MCIRDSNTTIQYYLEKELERTLNEYSAKGCYGVVMDCNTGAVLAVVEATKTRIVPVTMASLSLYAKNPSIISTRHSHKEHCQFPKQSAEAKTSSSENNS